MGLASDIELYDEFPQDYLSYIKRQHRWIRGDWQIADWFTPRVPRADGGRGANPLSWFNRWKIFDNLRRSLLPAASLALLMASWFDLLAGRLDRHRGGRRRSCSFTPWRSRSPGRRPARA